MDDDYEEPFKIAALNKLKKVNHLINEITIGPNAKKVNLKSAPSTKIVKPIEVEKQNRPVPNTGNQIPTRLNERISRIKQFTKSQEEQGKDSWLKSQQGLFEDLEKQEIIQVHHQYDQIPTRQFLQLLDLERQEKVQSALNERISRFEQFSKSQQEQGKQSWLKTQQTFIEDMERQEMNIIQVHHQYDLKQSTQHAKLAQLTQNAVQRMKQRQELLQEKERQRQILGEAVNKIKGNQHKFSLEYQQILGILRSCTDNDALKSAPGIDFSLLKTLPAEIESVVEKCKGDNISQISEKDGFKSDEILTKMVQFKNTFRAIVDSINIKKLEAERIKEASKPVEELKHVQQPPQQPSTQDTAPAVIVTETSKDTLDSEQIEVSRSLNKLAKYVSIYNLQVYSDLMEFLEKYRLSFKQLEDDNSLKNFKFDCKKAINIPVNALSGVNSEHIMDKYRKLNRLLSGQSVIISDKEVNASRHPQGIAFCTDLLAKKFVLQGDLMVSSNPESAFCYASVILSLWNDFPDFGKLLLAYFYKMCPYLVPYYIPRQVGESDEEFYIKQGYQYKDGEVEKQDKFLKRMTGIIKLYFAVLIAKPKRGQKSSPYNLKHGWKWLASFLRLEPQLDITATVLHVFLETVGFEMDTRYGKTFQKLLNVIIQGFLPKCREVKCTGGAITRLDLLLSDYIKNRKFEKPNGYIEYPYW